MRTDYFDDLLRGVTRDSGDCVTGEEARQSSDANGSEKLLRTLRTLRGDSVTREIATAPELRRPWSDRLCRRLHDLVSNETPAGLGHWNEAWRIVEAPSDDLLKRLERWEDAGAPEDKRAASDAARAVRAAWRDAAGRWRAAGCPDVDEAEAAHA